MKRPRERRGAGSGAKLGFLGSATPADPNVLPIGRSGRFGRKGVSINLLLADEMKLMKDIESYYSTQVTTLPEDLAGITLS